MHFNLIVHEVAYNTKLHFDVHKSALGQCILILLVHEVANNTKVHYDVDRSALH